MTSVARVAAVATSAVGVLAEPITFPNGKQAKNRFMKSPLTEKLFDWSNPDKLGLPSEAMKNIYSKFGHGGFGLIVTGSFAVDPKYISEAGQALVCRETFASNLEARRGLKELSSALKADGALAIAQLRHSGVGAIKEYTSSDGKKHVVNADIENPLKFSTRRLQEDFIERFVFAASVLYGSSFDGVELLAAFGSVFSQFLSTKKNERKDEYGGSVENRLRLLLETFRAIRKAVPAGFIIGVKLNSRDFQEFDMPREEVIRLCELIEEAGFDFVELSGGMMEMTMRDAITRDTTLSRENYFLEFLQLASGVFKNTQTYITGGWQTANSMVTSVEMGLTRGIGAGRWSCAEPDFPKKLIGGEIESIPAMRFPPFDFWYMKNAALWHVRQLSQTPFDERHGPSHGVTDFSVPEEAAHFQKACDAYKTHVDSLGTIDNVPGTIDYKPLNK